MSARFSSVTVTRPYEQIVEQIQNGIRDGSLVRGQKLPPERELAGQFGVSRGVVREAIKALSALGLVEPRQGRGIYVRNDPLPTVSRVFTLIAAPEERSIERLFELRRALELLAAQWAAARRSDAEAQAIEEAARAGQRGATQGDVDAFGDGDTRFHALIRAAADNPYLAAALGAVRDMQNDVISLFRGIPGSIVVASEHHLRIAEAIARRDPELAARMMGEHIDYTAEQVAHMLRQQAAHTKRGGGALTPDGA
jgi:GntR family transcriptional repressor for pyruvate dehydrogenase complex